MGVKNPWIVMGGSYAGAMTAWFRNKYPHLTIGGISSSGVVVAVEDFRMFDEQIYISSHKSGDFCNEAIVNVSNYVEAQVTGDNKDEFRASFNASYLSAREFLFYWSDVIVFQIQYGNRVAFCESLKSKTLEEQFTLVKDMALKVTPWTTPRCTSAMPHSHCNFDVMVGKTGGGQDRGSSNAALSSATTRPTRQTTL